MKILETLSIGKDSSLILVKVGNKNLLIGSTPHSVNIVDQLSDDEIICPEVGQAGDNSRWPTSAGAALPTSTSSSTRRRTSPRTRLRPSSPAPAGGHCSVFTGDIFQIDQPYLDIKSNGLTYLSDKMLGQEPSCPRQPREGRAAACWPSLASNLPGPFIHKSHEGLENLKIPKCGNLEIPFWASRIFAASPNFRFEPPALWRLLQNGRIGLPALWK